MVGPWCEVSENGPPIRTVGSVCATSGPPGRNRAQAVATTSTTASAPSIAMEMRSRQRRPLSAMAAALSGTMATTMARSAPNGVHREFDLDGSRLFEGQAARERLALLLCIGHFEK